jgi:hypothetical protein
MGEMTGVFSDQGGMISRDFVGNPATASHR